MPWTPKRTQRNVNESKEGSEKGGAKYCTLISSEAIAINTHASLTSNSMVICLFKASKTSRTVSKQRPPMLREMIFSYPS
jgi:hypothetical protein